MNTKNLLKTFELCINGKKKKFYSTLLNDEVPSKIEKECDKLEMPELIKKNVIEDIEKK